MRRGSIKSYPCTQRDYKDRTIASFSTLNAEYDLKCPADGEWFGAFDIWLGAWGALEDELMIWTHHRYNGTVPPRNAVESDKVTIDGIAYTAWIRPLNVGDSRSYIALAMDQARPSGAVDLVKIFAWLVGKGWLNAAQKLAAVEYGVEIADTLDGEREFVLDNFVLTAH